ncbi:hypothetical protein SAMN05892883_2101 [Jatrophihabitans sp. GAS493]|uniref:hypothetical protein n=1 Tax=Jatrophihabitans sp. GAS493 TaxID=1907575 RepID=UPI000BB91EDE|nr:hypothetical protein [Jatrophihabitans sp. GAS493]SOD72756.1 hypothetical protein SAMN05892883_2101 [Jatrophihabitans sp. GAS493]
MTAPRRVDCTCGHPSIEHAHGGLRICLHTDAQDRANCDCNEYDPDVPAPKPTTAPPALKAVASPVAPKPVNPFPQEFGPATVAAPAAGPSADAILEEAATSDSKRIVNLGERIRHDLDVLNNRLREDREGAQARRAARAEIAELEAALKIAKAKLRGGSATPATPSAAPQQPTPIKAAGEHPCQYEGCDRVFDTAQGRAGHQRFVHEGFDPKAVAAARSGAES